MGEQAVAAERTGLRVWPRVGGASLAIGLLYLSAFAVPPLITTLIDELRISHSQAGALMSVFLGGLLTTSLLTGRLGDRFGPRRLIGAGLLLGALAGAAFPLTETYPLLLLCRGVLGVAMGLVYAPGIAFVASLLPRARANLGVGVFLCGVPSGIVISFFSTPFLAESLSWRWPFWIFAAAAVAGAAVFRAASAHAATAVRRSGERAEMPVGELLASRPFRLVLVALFLGMFVVYGVFTWIAPYLDESAGFSTSQLSFTSGLLAMTGIPGTLGSGWLASRSGRPLAVSAVGFCLPALLVVFALQGDPSLGVATAVATIAAFGVSVGTSPLYAAGPVLFGAAGGGTASGLATAAGMSGAVTSTYAGGWIVGWSGYGTAFGVYVAVTAALAALVIPAAALSMSRHERHPALAEE